MQEMRVGIDDTDSTKGMCTTFLAYMITEGLLKRGAKFLEYPRLVRLNPNVPWKTRGNGAVALHFMVRDAKHAQRYVTDMISLYSDTKNGANPGAVFLKGDKITLSMKKFSQNALHKIVKISDVYKISREADADTFGMGTGRGMIGAMAAIGYQFNDITAELITYRNDVNLGTKRPIKADSVKTMQDATYPDTFSSYDDVTGQVLISPRGPDPVFYGLRGEYPDMLCKASTMIRHTERLRGHMIFCTNQGTGDHLQHAIRPDLTDIHSSGTINGTVSDGPQTVTGGHMRFSMDAKGHTIPCWTYRPTKLPQKLSGLVQGDRIVVGGGVRAESKNHPRAINVETVRVQRLVPHITYKNPHCTKCKKNMKSKGRGQGFWCVRCGSTAGRRESISVPRQIDIKEYTSAVTAQRHLARPPQRNGRINRITFDPNIDWFSIYENK